MTSFGRAGAVRNNTVAKAKELQELKPIFSSIFEDSDDDSEEESDDDNQTTLAKEECKTETNVAERLKKDELREGNSDGSMHASDSKKNSSFPETSSNVKFVKITPHIGSSISQIGGRGITRKKIKPLFRCKEFAHSMITAFQFIALTGYQYGCRVRCRQTVVAN